jgi:hypothetical protein
MTNAILKNPVSLRNRVSESHFIKRENRSKFAGSWQMSFCQLNPENRTLTFYSTIRARLTIDLSLGVADGLGIGTIGSFKAIINRCSFAAPALTEGTGV